MPHSGGHLGDAADPGHGQEDVRLEPDYDDPEAVGILEPDLDQSPRARSRIPG
jgi:hypothetical protein